MPVEKKTMSGWIIMKRAIPVLSLLSSYAAAICVDFDNWEDTDGWTCTDYAPYCDGTEDWDYDTYEPIIMYIDAQGNSPVEACCICGGGWEDNKDKTPPPTTDSGAFKALKEQMRLAPTSGVRTEILIDQSFDWKEALTVKDGQWIALVGTGQTAPVLDARSQNRHVAVESGGRFEASFLVFSNGKASKAGSIHNKGIITSLIDCAFQGNVAERDGGAILTAAKGTLISIKRCSFLDNTCKGEGCSGAALYFLESNAGVEISNSTFARNKAHVSDSYGGAISVQRVAGFGFQISNCNFIENLAVNGAAIYMDGNQKYGMSG